MMEMRRFTFECRSWKPVSESIEFSFIEVVWKRMSVHRSPRNGFSSSEIYKTVFKLKFYKATGFKLNNKFTRLRKRSRSGANHAEIRGSFAPSVFE